jgi:hypothetical protein
MEKFFYNFMVVIGALFLLQVIVYFPCPPPAFMVNDPHKQYIKPFSFQLLDMIVGKKGDS